MALFPRKIGGQYMMVGRQDGQNLFLLSSDSLDRWNGGDLLMKPDYPWEFVQIGNCGPPIEIDEGWLLLTHGVGAMRQYSIGAVLLDQDDPSKILGRTRQPILQAENDDRNGYVPNVVYTCGGLKVGDQLFMPYGISDSSVGFAFLPIKDLIAGDGLTMPGPLKLDTKIVEKPWGRRGIDPRFGVEGDAPGRRDLVRAARRRASST